MDDPDTRADHASSALDPDAVRAVAFALFGLLLSVKGDGRFPLPASLSATSFQLLLLPYTLTLYSCAAVFLWPDRVAGARWLRPLHGVVPRSTAALVLPFAALFELFALALLPLEAHKYSGFGYRLPPSVLVALAAIAVTGFALIAWRRRPTGLQLLMVAIVCYLGSQLVSVVSFPLHAGRSDMLPLIGAAILRFGEGASPYGLYQLPHTVPLTYLPGTWLSFLPVAALGLDLRMAHLLGVVGTAVTLYAAAPRRARELTGGLCALLLLTPYLQYRHEIYLGPQWLVLAAAAFLIRRVRNVSASAALGWGVASTPLIWVMLPPYLLHLWRHRGLRQAVVAATAATAVALALVAPFALAQPRALWDGVAGHWTGTLDVTTANLSYFLAAILTLSGLRWIQLVLWLAVVVLTTLRARPEDGPFPAMTACFATFLLLNNVVWVYLHLFVPVLLLCAAVTRPPSSGAR